MWSLIKTNFSPGGQRRWFKWSIFRRIQISKLTGRGCHVERWWSNILLSGQTGIRKYWSEHGNSISINAVYRVDKFEMMWPIMSDRNLMFTITLCKYNTIVSITHNMFGFKQTQFLLSSPARWMIQVIKPEVCNLSAKQWLWPVSSNYSR